MDFNELTQIDIGVSDVQKIDAIKSSKLPNYLCGDGQYSRLLIKLLENYDIKVDGIFTVSIRQSASFFA